jgi:DNA-binding MarR family transcriptional regulator
MLTRVPDITRLVDRLERAGHVYRERRFPEDRRLVVVGITQSGLRLLAKLDRPVIDLHQQQFRHLKRRELQDLKRLLAKVREA